MNYSFKDISVSELVMVFFIAIFTIFSFLYLQPQIVVGNGYGWDGIRYVKIFTNFSEATKATVDFPFCNRVGLPFLAYLTSISDASIAFKIINSTFAMFFSVFVYLIARSSGLNRYYSIFSFSLTLILFFSPARFIPYYPVYTDPPFLAFLAVSFLFLIKKKNALSFGVIVALIPFREAAVYVLPLFCFFALYLNGFSRKIVFQILFSLLAMFVIKLGIQSYFDCSGSQLETAWLWARKRITDPVLLIKYLAAISMTAAPIFCINYNVKMTNIEKISVVGFVFSALLAFVGGSDSTRIFYSFFPIYFLAIIGVIKSKGYLFSLFCFLGYLLSNSFGSKILEPLNYSPNNDISGFFWQFPDHGRPEISFSILLIWLLLFFFFNFNDKRQP